MLSWCYIATIGDPTRVTGIHKEAQFNIAHVKSNDTNFYHVLSAVPPTIIARVPADILNRKNYDELKSYR